MKLMQLIPKELQDDEYYIFLLDTLIKDNDHSLKHRLQKADTYAMFIKEQAGILTQDTENYMQEKEVTFLEASRKIVEQWKQRMFD